MNSDLTQYSNKKRLSSDYFKPRTFWRFNTPDFYPFYSVLAAIIAISIIITFVILLAMQNNRSQNHPTESHDIQANIKQSVALATTQPSPLSTPTPVLSNLEESPKSETTKPVTNPFESAEQQPSYSLRAEAYEKLRKAPELSSGERIRANAAYQRNKVLALQAQHQLAQALYGVDHEHFSQAIRQLKNLIAGGEILGDAFLKAQQALPKAYIKKIDYFLIQGQLSLARKALNEAKKAQISNEELAPYETKIKSLEKVSH